MGAQSELLEETSWRAVDFVTRPGIHKGEESTTFPPGSRPNTATVCCCNCTQRPLVSASTTNGALGCQVLQHYNATGIRQKREKKLTHQCRSAHLHLRHQRRASERSTPVINAHVRHDSQTLTSTEVRLRSEPKPAHSLVGDRTQMIERDSMDGRSSIAERDERRKTHRELVEEDNTPIVLVHCVEGRRRVLNLVAANNFAAYTLQQ